MSENYKLIEDLAKKDAATLVEKGKAYGDSWKKRGGVGAMMMLARKWDRIENIAKENNWDIFAAAGANTGDILDDIKDLRCYLLLVQAHVESEVRKGPTSPWKSCKVCGSQAGHGDLPCPFATHAAAPATTLQAPTSAQQHGTAARPSACQHCGAPGNHAGFPCPRLAMRSAVCRDGGNNSAECNSLRGVPIVKVCGYCEKPDGECKCSIVDDYVP